MRQWRTEGQDQVQVQKATRKQPESNQKATREQPEINQRATRNQPECDKSNPKPRFVIVRHPNREEQTGRQAGGKAGRRADGQAARRAG